ncbi:hypothetical protein ACFRLW_31765 [Streptomyces sp. NPDC056728]
MIIVSAGPTGLMLANELRTAGHSATGRGAEGRIRFRLVVE